MEKVCLDMDLDKLICDEWELRLGLGANYTIFRIPLLGENRILIAGGRNDFTPAEARKRLAVLEYEEKSLQPYFDAMINKDL